MRSAMKIVVKDAAFRRMLGHTHTTLRIGTDICHGQNWREHMTDEKLHLAHIDRYTSYDDFHAGLNKPP